MKPSAYKHIAAWCRLNGISDKSRRYMQRLAAKEGAEVDACYRVSYNGQPAHWIGIQQCGVQTRMSIERQLNHGSRK